MTEQFKEWGGEMLGTFILVFIGCGSVALTILFQTFGSLLEIALVWGFGVALAIFAVRRFCPAHLNPAVTFAMCLSGRHPWRKLPAYFLSQCVGAFLAGGLLYLIFSEAIAQHEQVHALVRGSDGSRSVAAMFGEFFPNPGYADRVQIDWPMAMGVEALGTFLLVFVIFLLTGAKKQRAHLIPILIGLTVSLLICLVAPYTQAGLNPARDFGPRMVAWMSGWGDAAFPSAPFSFFTVYILGPLLGGLAAAATHRLAKLRA